MKTRTYPCVSAQVWSWVESVGRGQRGGPTGHRLGGGQCGRPGGTGDQPGWRGHRGRDSLGMSFRDKQDQVKAKVPSANFAAASIAAVRQLDDLLVLAGNVNTDSCPGPTTPPPWCCPAAFRVVPRRDSFPTLQTVTNPTAWRSVVETLPSWC